MCVASWVRADKSVAIRIWNGSSACEFEIFSTAGSSMPEIASARRCITVSTGARRRMLRTAITALA